MQTKSTSDAYFGVFVVEPIRHVYHVTDMHVVVIEITRKVHLRGPMQHNNVFFRFENTTRNVVCASADGVQQEFYFFFVHGERNPELFANDRASVRASDCGVSDHCRFIRQYTHARIGAGAPRVPLNCRAQQSSEPLVAPLVAMEHRSFTSPFHDRTICKCKVRLQVFLLVHFLCRAFLTTRRKHRFASRAKNTRNGCSPRREKNKMVV